MIMIFSSFATEQVIRGGGRMEPMGIRASVSIYLAVGAGESCASTPPTRTSSPTWTTTTSRRSSTASVSATASASPSSWASTCDFSNIIQERIEPLDSDLESDDTLDHWLRSNVSTAQHISCTCKMGPASDPMAVVDQYGKVHGLENIRVVDASIMPDCIRANTNVTTMMIGERVSELILQGN